MAKGSKKLHNAFTEEELELIRKLYADTPNKVIATMMPHSFTSISKKAHTMGLKKTKARKCRSSTLKTMRMHRDE